MRKEWSNIEVWRPVMSYGGYFSDTHQVSDWGRVKSVERKVWVVRNGKGYWKKYPEVILKQSHDRCGYLQVWLKKDGRVQPATVHKLVYEAFNGPVPKGMQINHIDENKENNFKFNLNLLSPGDNSNWGTRNERVSKALTNYPAFSKAVQQFTKDGKFIAEFPSTCEAERQTGYNHGYISACCTGKYKSAYGYVWKFKEDISETPTSAKMPVWEQLDITFDDVA